MHVQVFDVLSAKQEVGMHGIRGRHKGRIFVRMLTTFRPVGSYVLQRYGRILFVNTVEQSFVANVLFRNEGNALALIF